MKLNLKYTLTKLRYAVPYHWEWCRSMMRDASAPAYPVDAVTADFFVSMGVNCRTAEHLRRHKLRICSSPLDWMMRFGLKDALALFRTGFATFFEDVRELPEDADGAEGKSRSVEDVQNGMVSIHHFPRTLTLEEGRAAYRERAARHFANTHRFMSDAKRIAMFSDTGESLESIAEFVEGMSELYKAELVHINFRNGPEKKRSAVPLARGAVLYDYTFPDVNFYERRGVNQRAWWLGNKYEWQRILKQCRRTSLFSPPEKVTRRKNSYN